MDTRKDDKSREKSDDGDENLDRIVVRDKITRTPEKQARKVSNNSKSHERKNSYEGKPKNHVSRTVDKLKSASDRRSSSSQSQKRRRSDSPVKPATEKPVSDTNMDSHDDNPDLKCPECDQIFDKDDSCLCCECCARWFHSKCHNISEEQVTAFKLLKDLAHYYCPNCKSGASELHKATVDMRYRVESLEKAVESLNKDNETNKTDVKNLQTQQKSNTTNLKTLKTVHETLRKENDINKTDIKTLQRSDKERKEEYEAIKANQSSNTIKLNTVSTRLDTIAEDIIGKIHTIIDKRVSETVNEQITARNLEENQVIVPTRDDEEFKRTIEEKVKENIRGSEDIQKTIDDKVKENVEKFQVELSPFLPSSNMEVDDENARNATAPKVNPTFSNAVMNVMIEKEEIRKRKLQVVITNVKESLNQENIDMKPEAEEVFTLMGVNVNIVEAIRVGKKKPERPRVIRVTLENFADKRTLLAKATSLRHIPQNHKYANVYVKPNLTHQQQNESKNLWRQLQEIKQKNPTIKYKISQGKIIVVPENN